MIRDLAYAGSVHALVLFVVALSAAGCDLDDATSAPPGPAAAARARAAQTARANEECRDSCEQTNIVAGGSDESLRACRDRCDARYGVTAPPHEVPTRIIQGKAVHAPPLVKPVRR